MHIAIFETLEVGLQKEKILLLFKIMRWDQFYRNNLLGDFRKSTFLENLLKQYHVQEQYFLNLTI